MLHHSTINSQGRCSMCRASQMFEGSVEVLMLYRVPFIESPAICMGLRNLENLESLEKSGY